MTPDARVIAAQYVGTIAAVFEKAGKTFDIDDDAMHAIVRLGHSPTYGNVGLVATNGVLHDAVLKAIQETRAGFSEGLTNSPNSSVRLRSSGSSSTTSTFKAGFVGN